MHPLSESNRFWIGIVLEAIFASIAESPEAFFACGSVTLWPILFERVPCKTVLVTFLDSDPMVVCEASNSELRIARRSSVNLP